MSIFSDIGEIVSPIANTIIGGAFNSSAQSGSQDWQAQQALYNRIFQQDERMATQQWQYDMYRQQFGDANKEYDRRLQQEREYNTPLAQLRRLQATGYSPDSLANTSMDDTFGVPQGVSVPSGSPSSGAMPAAVQPKYMDLPSLSSGFKDIGEAIAALSRGRLDDAQTTQLFKLLDFKVQNEEAEVKKKGLENEALSLANGITRLVKDNKVSQSFFELQQAKALAALYGQQHNVAIQEELNKQEERLLTQALRGKTDWEKTQIKLYCDAFPTIINSMVNLQKSQMAENYSAASLNLANANTINALREWQVEYNKYSALLEKSNYTVQNGTEKQQMDIIVNNALASEYMPKNAAEALRAARKNNDWYEVRMILDCVSTAVGAYASVKAGKIGQGYVNAADVRNDIEREFNNYKMQERPEGLYEYKNGHFTPWKK